MKNESVDIDIKLWLYEGDKYTNYFAEGEIKLLGKQKIKIVLMTAKGVGIGVGFEQGGRELQDEIGDEALDELCKLILRSFKKSYPWFNVAKFNENQQKKIDAGREH